MDQGFRKVDAETHTIRNARKMDEPKDLPPEYQEFLASQENLDDLDSPIDGDSESISSISNSKASGDFIRNPALPKRKSVLGLPTGRDYTDHHKVAERPSPYTAVSDEKHTGSSTVSEGQSECISTSTWPSNISSRASTLSGDTLSPSALITPSIRRKPIGSAKSQNSLSTSFEKNISEKDVPKDPKDYETEIPLVQSPLSGPGVTAPSSSLAQHLAHTKHSNIAPRRATDNMVIRKRSESSNVSADQVNQASGFDIEKLGDDGYPLLVRVARDGIESMVVKLLASNANIEAVHIRTKRTALVEAAAIGHEKIVGLLLQYGYLVDHADGDSLTSLHYAALRGNIAVAKHLLENGATIDSKGPQDKTPLHFVTGVLYASMVMLLLQRHANINAKDAFQRCALHISASHGDLKMCSLLLDHGCQVDSRDINLQTPLTLAAEARSLDVFDLLLARSNLKSKDSTFNATFFAAVEAGKIPIAERCIASGLSLKSLGNDSYKSATLAAKSGNVEMLDLMIRQKCRIKDKDNNGWTSLHFAADDGHAAIVEALLEKHIPGKATTSKKETPLHLAVKGGHFAAIDLLLRGKGESQLGSKDSHDQQPVHHAVRGGIQDIWNIMISHNAATNNENKFGWRPLHIAVAYGHKDILEQLVARGANIEEKLGTASYTRKDTHITLESGYWAEARWPYPGSRPLHLAIEYGRDDMARFLISMGADVDVACSEGWRPLHHAAFNGSLPMVQLLLDSQAYVHATTDEGKTAHALPFRTSGEPIPEATKIQVQVLLTHAMASTPKQKKEQFKSVWRLKGKGADDKNDTLQAAYLAANVISRRNDLAAAAQPVPTSVFQNLSKSVSEPVHHSSSPSQQHSPNLQQQSSARHSSAFRQSLAFAKPSSNYIHHRKASARHKSSRNHDQNQNQNQDQDNSSSPPDSPIQSPIVQPAPSSA